jgi:hypothetical protein
VADPLPLYFEIWKHYEVVAMHFNDLIMRWRLQAMGGLASLITIGGFIVKNTDDAGLRYRAMLILALTFLFGWIGVAVIDLFYYRKLLRGAVDALLALEGQHETLTLSTIIEKRAAGGHGWTPWVFYCIGAVPLIGLIGWAWYNLAFPLP